MRKMNIRLLKNRIQDFRMTQKSALLKNRSPDSSKLRIADFGKSELRRSEKQNVIILIIIIIN